MNKRLSLLLALCLIFSFALVNAASAQDITLWTYPVGNWGNAESVQALIDKFNEVYPDIKVTVELLDYTNGDDQVNTAIEGGQAPDIIFEGPERLVANWGAKGLMVDLADLWAADYAKEIYPAIESACHNAEGAYYEFPVCMTAHNMAINYDMFEAADALQYIDVENHTWTTEGFINAVNALYANGQENVGAVYCSGQGGDQGTRALINNLYGGTFTNPEHTAYTADSPENVKALELLQGLNGINIDPSINGGEEIQLFCNEPSRWLSAGTLLRKRTTLLPAMLNSKSSRWPSRPTAPRNCRVVSGASACSITATLPASKLRRLSSNS